MRGPHFRVLMLCFAVMLVVAGCSGSGRTGPVNNSQLRLQQLGLVFTVVPNKTTYARGELVTLSLNVTNNSSQTVTLTLISNDPEAFPPLQFFISLPSSGQVIFLSGPGTINTITLAPGQTATIGTFVWDQTNSLTGNPVNPGTYKTNVQIGGVIVNGETIVNPFGTIFFPGPNITITP